MNDNLKAEIKKMELERHAASSAKGLAQKRVKFDVWFSQRKDLIPPIHKKEILAADFKARGLESEATMEQFDRALKLYGVSI
jgi:hypothetical protein